MAVDSVPKHIAIVMDGNGRWASGRFLPRIAGHRQGVEVLKRTARACAKRGVEVLTVFAFSSENWKRPPDEVSALMDILVVALSREVAYLQKEGVKLHFIGAREALSERVQKSLQDGENQTAGNTRLTLNICFNYGGRWDIVQAARRVVASGEPLTEANLARALSTVSTGDPDLIVRTGGEMRLSNFLLWQAAYSELYFSQALWPDFDEAALDAAIQAYAMRERRFGMTSEQLLQSGAAA
ncbi:MAG: polyprenyl diphosphate synthase [Rhodoferax sp.]|nr:polyprenyl diphosphate synthase [Rhodoferax sp.]